MNANMMKRKISFIDNVGPEIDEDFIFKPDDIELLEKSFIGRKVSNLEFMDLISNKSAVGVIGQLLQDSLDQAAPFSDIILPDCQIDIDQLKISKPVCLRGGMKTKIIIREHILIDLSKFVPNFRESNDELDKFEKWKRHYAKHFFIAKGSPEKYQTDCPKRPDKKTDIFSPCTVAFESVLIEKQKVDRVKRGKSILSINKAVKNSNAEEEPAINVGFQTTGPLFMLGPESSLSLDSCIVKCHDQIIANLIGEFEPVNTGIIVPQQSATKENRGINLLLNSTFIRGFKSLGSEKITRFSSESTYYENFRETIMKFKNPYIIKIHASGFGLCGRSCLDLTNVSPDVDCNVIIEDTRFAEIFKTCILLGSKNKPRNNIDVKITNCNFSYNQSRCIDGAGYLGSLSVQNCEFDENGGDCIRLTDVTPEVEITHCNFLYSRKNGVSLSGTSGRISDCDVTAGGFGFYVEGYSESIETKDTYFDEDHQYLGQTVFIGKNTISNTSGAGITLMNTKCLRVNIQENVVTGCLHGVLIDDPIQSASHHPNSENDEKDNMPSLKFFGELNHRIEPPSKSARGELENLPKIKWTPARMGRAPHADESIELPTDISFRDTDKNQIGSKISLLRNKLFDNWFTGVKIRSAKVPVYISGGRIAGSNLASIGYISDNCAEITVNQSGLGKVEMDASMTSIDDRENAKEIDPNERVEVSNCTLV